MLLLWLHSIPFLLRTLPRADMESAPTVCQSRNILPAANFGGVGAPRPTSYRKRGTQGGQPSGRRARFRPQQTFRAIPPPSPRRQKPPFDKGGRTVEKLHPCLIACVGATMGRPSAYRRNAISGTVFIHGKRARASNARPYKSVSTRCPNLKLHFKFHSCKIRQSVLQSHSIPF